MCGFAGFSSQRGSDRPSGIARRIGVDRGSDGLGQVTGVKSAMPNSKIQSLQVFRGVAATAVVVHHANLSTATFVGELPLAVSNLLNLGLLGVDFFFVLSGFIIMYAHLDDARTFGAVRKYAIKRLARIYPAYLPVGVGMVLLYAALPEFSASGGREFSLASSLFLMPADHPPALSVAWTLVHELMFYAVFLLFFVSVRWLTFALLAWALVIVGANLAVTPAGWLRYPLSYLNIEFMLGVASAWLVRRRPGFANRAWLGYVGVGLALLALMLIAQDENQTHRRLLLALGLAMIIALFAARERAVAMRWPAVLLLLGNASYSIYLVHNPLLSVTQRMAGRLAISWPVAVAVGVTLCLLAGCIYFWMVEQPVLRLVRQRLRAT